MFLISIPFPRASITQSVRFCEVWDESDKFMCGIKYKSSTIHCAISSILQFYKSTIVEQEKELKCIEWTSSSRVEEKPKAEKGKYRSMLLFYAWEIYCYVIVGFSSFICSRFSTSHTVSKATRRRRVDIVGTAWNFFSCIFSQSARQHANLNGAQESNFWAAAA